MRCPRCHTELTLMETKGVKLDICYGGCGGVWFDNFELERLDEKHEADEEFLRKIEESRKITADLEPRINCPKCPNVVMMRHFFSVAEKVTVDECANCGGYWLDVGELTQIHALFKTEKDRKEAFEKQFLEQFSLQLKKNKDKNDKKLQAARKFARALKYLCPSYYIKGKQDWGAF